MLPEAFVFIQLAHLQRQQRMLRPMAGTVMEGTGSNSSVPQRFCQATKALTPSPWTAGMHGPDPGCVKKHGQDPERNSHVEVEPRCGQAATAQLTFDGPVQALAGRAVGTMGRRLGHQAMPNGTAGSIPLRSTAPYLRPLLRRQHKNLQYVNNLGCQPESGRQQSLPVDLAVFFGPEPDQRA
jgi:hypothetical protein